MFMTAQSNAYDCPTECFLEHCHPERPRRRFAPAFGAGDVGVEKPFVSHARNSVAAPFLERERGIRLLAQPNVHDRPTECL